MPSQKKRGTKRSIRSVSGHVPKGRAQTKKLHYVRPRTNMNNLANAFKNMYINKRRKPRTKKNVLKNNQTSKSFKRSKQAIERRARAARRSHLRSKKPSRSSKKKSSRSSVFSFNNMMKALNQM